jgi:hypothetical protein
LAEGFKGVGELFPPGLFDTSLTAVVCSFCSCCFAQVDGTVAEGFEGVGELFPPGLFDNGRPGRAVLLLLPLMSLLLLLLLRRLTVL